LPQINRAIIFAAGRGSRLGPYTHEIPKTLLAIGNLTIFDRIVMGLDGIGVRDIVVVTGHAGPRLQSHAVISQKLSENRVCFEFIVNSNLDLGNIYSFWLARDRMVEDCIVVNSDVVFHHGILELLRNNPSDTALVIENSKSLGLEQMKVKINDKGVVKEIAKELDPQAANGEYIGIMKISRNVAKKVIGKAEDLLSAQKFPLYYEDAFRLLAREEDCLFACSTEGLPWSEVDTEDDMHHTINRILPQIQSSVRNGLETEFYQGQI